MLDKSELRPVFFVEFKFPTMNCFCLSTCVCDRFDFCEYVGFGCIEVLFVLRVRRFFAWPVLSPGFGATGNCICGTLIVLFSWTLGFLDFRILSRRLGLLAGRTTTLVTFWSLFGVCALARSEPDRLTRFLDATYSDGTPMSLRCLTGAPLFSDQMWRRVSSLSSPLADLTLSMDFGGPG